jgi:predicted anti-sigma-YlaC factor YlaD|tara:strand:- start:9439 stop:10344 length:906 start_codon:yes stop_codon:yes gene_type:complete
MERSLKIVLLVLVSVLNLTACSINRLVVDKLGDALAEGGSVFTSEEDPDLVRQAIPFGLKTYERLLDVSPQHEGLLLSAATGFAAYAYLIQLQADSIDELSYVEARRQRARASRLFLRGRDYALRGLEVRHPGFTQKLRNSRAKALRDVSLLYWAGVSWAGALTAAKDDPFLIAEVAIAAALVERVLELDESYNSGAAHEFFITFEGSRMGGSVKRARSHYRRAVTLSEGKRASVHLALAEVVAVQQQNLIEFRQLLAQAMAVDADEVPSLRLENTIAQDRAKWLEARIPALFVSVEEELP